MADRGAVDILAVHAELRGGKTALIGPDRSLTFSQLNARANRAANAFRALGVGSDSRVAWMSYNSLVQSEAAHACRKLQAVSVPINYRLLPPEIAYVLTDSGSEVVWVGRDFLAVVEEARRSMTRRLTCIAVDAPPRPGWLAYEDLLATATDEEPPSDDLPRLGASMIYTSGTTGRPKGAYRARGVPIEYALQAVAVFELRESDVHLLCGPAYHSAPGFFATLHQMIGATLVVQPKFDPLEALQLIAQHGVTTTFMAPTLLQRLLDLPDDARRRYDVSSLRAVILGAAPCPQALKERAIAWLGQVIWEFYGATETSINTVLRPEDQLRKPGSCGQAVPGQEIRLLDADGHEVPTGTPGELWVRNEVLAEYYKQPDATSASMRDGYFSVGDIAYRDDEGYYFICDRRVDMIISGGSNIYPAEVEAVLHAHPGVADAAVIGVPDAKWGEAVKAIVVPRPGVSVTDRELIDWCAQRLAGYKKPRSVDFAAELPRSPAGKLLKREIRAPYWERAGRRV
jgi:fatty-acyl-CoA synthase/long-chain acyl-CoA synthetase